MLKWPWSKAEQKADPLNSRAAEMAVYRQVYVAWEQREYQRLSVCPICGEAPKSSSFKPVLPDVNFAEEELSDRPGHIWIRRAPLKREPAEYAPVPPCNPLHRVLLPPSV